MKKIFLIPLMTLLCTVMAWGVDVSTLAAFTQAVQDGNDIRLTANITATSAIVFSSPITIDLNGNTLKMQYKDGNQYFWFSSDVTFNNTAASAATLTATPGNYAIYADWATVTLNGNIDVSGDIYTNWGSIVFSSTYSGKVEPPTYAYIEGLTIEDGCTGKFNTTFKEAASSYLAEGQMFEQSGNYWVLAAGQAEVAQIGSTTYPTLAAAVDAATSGQTITLLEDVAEEVTIENKNITLAGDKSITRPLHLVGNITLTMAGVTIDAPGYTHGIRLDGNNNTYVINLADGTTNTIAGQYGIGGYNSNPTLTISGNGTLNINAQTAFANMVSATVSASNLKANISGKIAETVTTLSLQAGKYSKQPTAAQLADGYITVLADEYYTVRSLSDVAVAYYNEQYYLTLADALTAAASDETAVVYLTNNVTETLSINKNTVLHTNGFSVANSVSAASGYVRFVHPLMANTVMFLETGIAAFMTQSEAIYTATHNVDLSFIDGYIPVTGNKTLIINEGVTVTLPSGNEPGLGVENGASLTLKGKGTLRGAKSPIKVFAGGTLVIGEENSNDDVTIVTSLGEGSQNKNWAIENLGTATIHNVNIDARSGAIYNRSNAHMTINKSHIIGRASSVVDGYAAWTYAVINDGIMSLNNAYVQGIHGAVSCETGNATLDIRNCDLRAYNTPGKEDAYAALYVATNAVVNVYNTDLYSDRANYAAYIGNNDVHTTFGIINLYSGRLSSKMYVQNLKPTDADFVFPVSIPASSTWYSSFKNYGPLPAGSEYFDIDEDGYKYEVRVTSTDTKEIVDPATTITWQQSSTWKAGESSETTTYVPEETTIVTIPTGKDVVISNDADDNNGMTDAVADQIFVNQGASLTVESGTTLTVGDGGMNIANGGSITVEPGAVVKIGTAGVITTEKDALVLVSNDDQQAALLYDPTVPQSENTQPKATVKLETKSKQIGDQSYVYERFAIPTLNGAETTYKIEGGIPKTAGKPNETVALYNDAPSFLQAVWAWDNNAGDWQQLNSMLEMKPFNGYQLTNNSANGGLVYVFEGNLVGNNNGTYEFVEDGFHFFGNSYSAEINIKKFLNDLASGAEKSVWLYDPYDKTFKVVTPLTSNGRIKYGDAAKTPMTDIRSMQAFIMMLNNGTNATVDYASAIWGNPKYNPSASPAPARETVAEDWATIKVASANGQKDEFTLVQSEEFSSAFENGADASKFMNKENINLYATTNAGNLAMVATDNIDRTVLAFAAGEATEYTISFEGVEGNEFTLRDIITGAMVSMTEGATYTFTQEANTTNAARFEILGSAKLPTAIENVEAEAKTHGIYTIAGQFVGNDFNALSAGVYVVNGVKIVK